MAGKRDSSNRQKQTAKSRGSVEPPHDTRFKKGQSGNPRGRPRGTGKPTHKSLRALAAAILEDPGYQERLMKRAEAGKLHPSIEQMLWHYTEGKPASTVKHDVGQTLADILRESMGVGAASDDES